MYQVFSSAVNAVSPLIPLLASFLGTQCWRASDVLLAALLGWLAGCCVGALFAAALLSPRLRHCLARGLAAALAEPVEEQAQRGRVPQGLRLRRPLHLPPEPRLHG